MTGKLRYALQGEADAIRVQYETELPTVLSTCPRILAPVNVRIGFFGESYFHLREGIKPTFVFLK
jgi:hypothetical protein